MLTFTPVSHHKPGTLAFLLNRSYAEMLHTDGRYWEQEKGKWAEFDREVFENAETVGRCVFLTRLGDEIIGFGSFAPIVSISGSYSDRVLDTRQTRRTR